MSGAAPPRQHRIRAVVRVRPLLPFEASHTTSRLAIGARAADAKSQTVALRCAGSASGSGEEASREFRVDAVFPPAASQQDVFDGCNVRSMVGAVCKGYNATVFVYGQTGSGKTFTMDGMEYTAERNKTDRTARAVARPVAMMEADEHRLGIMPRTIMALFAAVEGTNKASDASLAASEPRKYRVRVSYVQIYNEQVYDLLNPGHLSAAGVGIGTGTGAGTGAGAGAAARAATTAARGKAVTGLRVRWTKDDDFYVENLFLCECYTAEEAIAHLQVGMRRKIMAAHSMNASSSRSHCIFQLHVESFAVSRPAELLQSRFSLVDLAGSERVSRTHATGVTLKESIAINKSLFVLRSVIKALALAAAATASTSAGACPEDDVGDDDPTMPRGAVAHFRDSKLTSLLKHSLGGNSLTLMIACVSGSDEYCEENRSTLSYAALAQRICNSVSVNEDPRTRAIRELQREIHALQGELAAVRSSSVRCSSCSKVLTAGGDPSTEEGEATLRLAATHAPADGRYRALLNDKDQKLQQLDSDNTLLQLENQRLRERVEILEYLLGQSDTGDAPAPASAPSSEQSWHSSSHSAMFPVPLAPHTRLPPLAVEEEEPSVFAQDAAQAMAELTQLLRARAGLRTKAVR